MTIETIIVCRKCGKEYGPTHIDFVRGVWRLCPTCRDGPKEDEYVSHESSEQSLAAPGEAA